MNSRERTYLALARKPADRLPVDFWASRAIKEQIEKSVNLQFDAFLDKHDVDLRYIDGPAYVGPPLRSGMDIWGVKRTRVRLELQSGTESYSEVEESPLASALTARAIESYGHWPSADWFDYSLIERQCDDLHARGRAAVFMGDRLNRVAQLKPAMYLRGVERILIDLAEREETARAIFGGIRGFYLEYLERILAAARGKLDIVLTGDDFGSQGGLLISPEMWRAFIGPGFAAFIKLIKEHGARAMHHTCGSVAGLIPDMIRCGLDVLQSVQPEADGMRLPDLAARFGERLCFHGGISVQRTMPFGTEEEIRREVADIAGLFREKGGYIFCTSHNIQADTPMRNVEALMRAYRDYGGAG